MSELSSLASKFILHWGSMGTRWGINRTVAQIHALLYVSDVPLPADEIADALEVARSNVSTSLKELQGWGLVRTVVVPGDRRDHFETHSDVWEMFRIVLDERKRRELDPTLAILRECVEEAREAGDAEARTGQRIAQLLEFFEATTTWYDELRRLPVAAIRRLMRLGVQVRRLAEGKRGG